MVHFAGRSKQRKHQPSRCRLVGADSLGEQP